VDTSAAIFVGGLIGAALGAASVLSWRFSEKSLETIPPIPEPVVPPGVAAVLAVLRSSALVVDRDDEVLKASAPAHMMGLVDGTRVAVRSLLDIVHKVARDGQIREEEIILRPLRGQTRHVAARVAPLGSRLVLVLVEDRTRERAADVIRRDFVANVSHELKTPIGALALLAEAVTEASRDPAAVERVAERMRMESERLGRLVQQIIELSRLQGDEPLEHGDVVPVNVIVTRAIDRVGVDAADKGIEIQFAGVNGLRVRGDGDQLIVALGNLVENAVAYSPDGGRVTVAAREHGSVVELVVTDHGVGIPAAEIDRIFERFYRVDPARARATGGTGLGLSIVKHVAATHGGEVRVWSVPGQGSTFTLVLPALAPGPEAAPETEPPATAFPRERVLASMASDQEEIQ
jgi:two-component system sensor histidine kinase SenX3